MGLFGQSTPFDADIDKATSEKNTNEDWSLILDICDKVSSNPRNAKDCLKAIMKRMGHTDPFVVMQAITLLDACVNNCGKPFHLEIASRDFENEFRRLLTKAQPKMSLKMRQVLKNWAENDFKNDPELNLIPSLYNKLRAEGHDFSNLDDKPTKAVPKVSKDPNVVQSQQEEDDIAKAIELSLKETKGSSPKAQSSGSANTNASSSSTSAPSSAYPSLYPSFGGGGGGAVSGGGATSNGGGSPAAAAAPQPEPRKVRALYDFEAAEENELTFIAGEIIHVLDDSDPNWWKGFNQRGDGLFPSNFVTADLSVDPELLDINQQNKQNSKKKNAQFDDDDEDDAKALQLKTEAAAAAAARANQRIEIDEAKIDRLLHLLHEANPEDPSQDSEEMLQLEQEVHQMGPLIDAELERVDRKHAQLTQLSSDLVDAINLYHSLMRDDRANMLSGGGGAAYMAGGMPGGAMPGLGYHGPPNAQMLYASAGYPGGVGNNFPNQPMPPQGFGMSSLPSYAMNAGGQMPPTSLPASQAQLQQQPHQQQHQMPIPMQLQNGHLNGGHQMNGGGFNGLPQQHLGHPQQTQQQQQQQPQQQPIYATPNQPSSLPPQSQINYQMLQQQQQQQQPQQTHFAPQNPAMNVVTSSALNGTVPQSQPPTTSSQLPSQPTPAQSQPQPTHSQPQFMSPQHQQPHAPYMPTANQQAQQATYAPIPNGMQPAYMPMHNNNANPNGSGSNNSNNNNNSDQYSQLQQQMAAMSMLGNGGVDGGIGGGVVGGIGGIGPGVALNHHQPVTQSFLVQNEPKNNIPIYQQQR